MIVENGPADRARFWEDQLTEGVMSRRVIAWFIDALLIGILVAGLFVVGLMLGLVTFGLTLPMLGVLPVVPLLYHWLTLGGAMSASPGQALMGISVRNYDDLAPPTMPQALGFTLLLYLTLAAGAFWLLVALVTTHHRTFHDMLSDVVVVRTRALTMLHDDWNMGRPAPGHRTPGYRI
jgi:uncharacterized RDD family membrane protein YckC